MAVIESDEREHGRPRPHDDARPGPRYAAAVSERRCLDLEDVQ